MATWKKVVTESSSGLISQKAANVSDADYGDITVSSGSWTIDSGVVDATALNVTGNGTSGYSLTSNGSGGFNWTDIDTASNLTISNFAGATIQLSSESWADNDTSLMTSAAINDRIQAISTNNSGTVVAVNTGTGLDGTITSSGTITLDLSELTDMTTDVSGSADELILLDNGEERRKQINEIKLGQFNNDQSWTANAGTVTSVTAGDGMTQSGTSSVNPTLNVVGGTGVSVTANAIAIGQAVGTTDNVTFNNVHIDGNLEVTGTIDTVSQTNTEIVDKTITINQGGANLAAGDQAGIVVDTGTTLKPALKWADDNMSANVTDIPGCGWYIDQLCETPSASNRVYLAGMKVSNTTPGSSTKSEGEGMFYYEKDAGELYICSNSATSGGSN